MRFFMSALSLYAGERCRCRECNDRCEDILWQAFLMWKEAP